MPILNCAPEVISRKPVMSPTTTWYKGAMGAKDCDRIEVTS